MADPNRKTERRISVFLADDNLIVREGVRALLAVDPDIELVGMASDADELIAGVDRTTPLVIVTDIRMPPTFQSEGIQAAKELRKRHPGTGVVVLSQYDEPDYIVSLLSDGAAGMAYLLKDRLAEGDQLVRAVREVAIGGSMLDPKLVNNLLAPVSSDGDVTAEEEELLRLVTEGRAIKAIAAERNTTATDISRCLDEVFVKLAEGVSAGKRGALKHLRLLHQAIVERETQGETLSRLLPGGLAEKLRSQGRPLGETERLTVTVLMCDIRGYTAIAEVTDPADLAAQLNEHRAAMARAVLAEGGTVMQFVGDAVLAVFGAPFPQADHADRALAAAKHMHRAQAEITARWRDEGLAPFGLGIGLSTGVVVAALLGSEERLEYSVVGDTVNLAQRIQEWAKPGETVLSDATYAALSHRTPAARLEPAAVKGRSSPVSAYLIAAAVDSEGAPRS